MSSLLLMPLILLAGFAGGWCCHHVWSRRQRAVRPGGPAAAGTPDSAVPAAAPPQAPAQAPAPAVVAAPPPSMDLHLVLNVMNRVVMGMPHDEHLQDGVTYMADYLRAGHELQRSPSQKALVQQVSTYWQLSRWVHGQASDALHIDAQFPGMSPAMLARCNAELIRIIRQLESCARADASMRIGCAPAGAEAPGSALLQVTVAGVPAPAQAQLLGAGREWSLAGTSLLLQAALNP